MMDSSLPIQLDQRSLISRFKSGELSSYLIRHFTGEEKAAVFLIAVGPDTASRILQHLDSEEVVPIMAAVTRLMDVSKGIVMAVLDELEHTLSSPNFKGGETYTTTLLYRAFGERQGALLKQRLSFMRPPEQFPTQLSQIRAETLMQLLLNETAQTIAVVLSALGPKRASELFALMPSHLKADVSPRLAQLKSIQPEWFHAIEDTLLAKLKKNPTLIQPPAPQLNVNGVKAIGKILAHSSPTQSQHILREVQNREPALAEQMQQAMHTFDELTHLAPRDLQLFIQRAPRQSLLYSLKIASPDVQTKFFANMTQRQAGACKEDMQCLPPIRKSDAQAYQRELIALARQLDHQGEIIFGAGKTDRWIE